jgi:hypothetical protein
MGAIYFGGECEDAIINSKGETIQLSKITKQGTGFRLLEELGTDPRGNSRPVANRKYAAPGELKEKGTAEKTS